MERGGGTILLDIWAIGQLTNQLVVAELAADGIPTEDFALLSLVGITGPTTASEIVARIGAPFMTVSDALARLEARGEITRRPNPADRRSHIVEITQLGRARSAAGGIAVRRALARLEAASDSSLDDLRSRLVELTGALQRALAENREPVGSITET